MKTRMGRRDVVCAGLCVVASAGMDIGARLDSAQHRAAERAVTMDTIAEQYVKLVLALGQHDADYVDAYYGPPEWKTEAAASQGAIWTRSARARSDLARRRGRAPAPQPPRRDGAAAPPLPAAAALGARGARPDAARASACRSTRSRARSTMPSRRPFPSRTSRRSSTGWTSDFPGTDRWSSATTRSGAGSSSRATSSTRSFSAPSRHAASARCSTSSSRPDEQFTVEYVTNKSWSGYNWYQGNFRSLIQVNTDLPIYIDRAIDLACHEGYPGHHVYNALLEKHLVQGRGWIEFSVYPLFSPQSLIAEGTANFGIEVAFPGPERAAFERTVLFPAAGLDPARAAEYYEVQALVDQLSYAGNEAARRYLNGQIDAAQAAAWLERYALMPHDRAAQRVRSSTSIAAT